MTTCLHTLCALLDFNSHIKPQSVVSTPIHDSSTLPTNILGSASMESLPQTSDIPNSSNLFRHYLKRIHRTTDFEMLCQGLVRLLKNPLDASQTYLPGSAKKLGLSHELWILFWQLLTTNPKFTEYVCESNLIIDFVRILLEESLNARTDVSELGHMRLLATILHFLSQNRQFGVQLNAPFNGNFAGGFKVLPRFVGGCWADALFLVYLINLDYFYCTLYQFSSSRWNSSSSRDLLGHFGQYRPLGEIIGQCVSQQADLSFQCVF